MPLLQSESQKEIQKAFSKAQALFKNPKKNVEAENENESFKTAPLSTFFDAVRRPFKLNGLSFSQSLSGNESFIFARTRIMHESGEWFETEGVYVKAISDSPKDRGSAIYIAKKNSFCAIMGLTGENETEDLVAEKQSRNNFNTPSERKDAKRRVVDDLKQVDSPEALQAFELEHRETIDKLAADDADYIADINRELKLLKKSFHDAKDNLKGKI